MFKPSCPSLTKSKYSDCGLLDVHLARILRWKRVCSNTNLTKIKLHIFVIYLQAFTRFMIWFYSPYLAHGLILNIYFHIIYQPKFNFCFIFLITNISYIQTFVNIGVIYNNLLIKLFLSLILIYNQISHLLVNIYEHLQIVVQRKYRTTTSTGLSFCFWQSTIKRS